MSAEHGVRVTESEAAALSDAIDGADAPLVSRIVAATRRPARADSARNRSAAAAASPSRLRARRVAGLARSLGLTLVSSDALTITRRRAGGGYCFRDATGARITDRDEIRRMNSLAVPPAYTQVRYAADPNAHLQAIGTDAAGRLQYRYHPRWEEVRGRLKAERLASFAAALPAIRRAVARDLAAEPGSRVLALAAVIELVTLSAIRAGEESYARERGTRGAATLLKSNLRLSAETLTLCFRAKGGKKVMCEIVDVRFRAVVERLIALPGRRMFQYRGEDGAVRAVRAGDVNAYLKTIAGVPVSLKDFRTLVASAGVLQALSQMEPAAAAKARSAQIKAAVEAAALQLHNTPAICRKSYVLPAVVEAFEDGTLSRFSATLRRCRSSTRRAAVLAELIRKAG